MKGDKILYSYIKIMRLTSTLSIISIMDCRLKEIKGEEKMSKTILINKLFLNKEMGASSHHEVIDFMLTDDGRQFVYNINTGSCGSDIWVEGTTVLSQKAGETNLAKYMVLVEPGKAENPRILYVITLKEKLHRLTYSKKNLNENVEKAQKLIRDLDIKYNGKYLYEYFAADMLYLSFEAAGIYKPNFDAKLNLTEKKLARIRTLVNDTETPTDYNNLEALISEIVKEENRVDLNQYNGLEPQEVFARVCAENELN